MWGVSPRHLSFAETGRSRPSPELLLVLADRLEVPLRERNTVLLAAGYAPRYPPTSLGDPARTLLSSPTGAEPAVTRILRQNGFGSKGTGDVL